MRYPEKQTITEVMALLHDQPFNDSDGIIRNVKTLSRRCSHEGMSFLTKTLPLVGKRFDSALSGNVAFNITGLLKKCGYTCFPHFLGSALRRIFDSAGFLLEKPCYDTVRWLRTLFYYAYKVEVPFSDELIDKFSENFRNVDSELINIVDNVPEFHMNRMAHMLKELDSYPFSLPAFGPGVSSNCDRDDKFNQFVPPSPIRNYFGRNFWHQSNYLLDAENSYVFCASLLDSLFGLQMPFEGFSPSKVLFVPKDSRGPRTICCEDSRLMWTQKALQKTLYQGVESSKVFGGRVNFTDQTINQRKTFDKRFASLDLKEASDRVSYDLVMKLFPAKMATMLDLCRSPYAQLPNGELIHLKKFAPMGSAVCFPVMALIAFTAVVTLISHEINVPTRSIEVYVYGDDIIVPNEYASIAIRALNSVGLVVNEGKSFINSRFTESCGADTLDQSSVTPLRKKKLFSPAKKDQMKGKPIFRDNGYYAHVISLANRCRDYRYLNLYTALRSHVQKTIPRGYVIPYGLPTSPYLNWHVDERDVRVFNLAAGYERNGKIRAMAVRDTRIDIRISPEQRLLRNLLENGGEIPIDPLKTSARSNYVQNSYFKIWGMSYA